MEPQILVILFSSIGVISGFLAFSFVMEKFSALKLFLAVLIISIGCSLVASVILADIDGCGFVDALLMRSAECGYSVFVNTRVIAVFNGLAVSSLFVVVLSLVRIIFSVILGWLRK